MLFGYFMVSHGQSMRFESQPNEQAVLRARFEGCVERCADSMYRVAFRLTGDATSASELVQCCYLVAWENIATLKDHEKMRGWMFAILRNQYSKSVRSEKKIPMVSDVTLEPESSLATLRQQESTAAIVDVVQSCLARLDDKFKLPILLVSMEGISVDEAAEVLGVPRGTVLSRLQRGRKKLKQLLLTESVTKKFGGQHDGR